MIRVNYGYLKKAEYFQFILYFCANISRTCHVNMESFYVEYNDNDKYPNDKSTTKSKAKYKNLVICRKKLDFKIYSIFHEAKFLILLYLIQTVSHHCLESSNITETDGGKIYVIFLSAV